MPDTAGTVVRTVPDSAATTRQTSISVPLGDSFAPLSAELPTSAPTISEGLHGDEKDALEG